MPFGYPTLLASHGPSGAAGAAAGSGPMGAGAGSSSSSANSARTFILTTDNLPAIYLLRAMVTHKANVLLAGPTGEGTAPLPAAVAQLQAFTGH